MKFSAAFALAAAVSAASAASVEPTPIVGPNVQVKDLSIKCEATGTGPLEKSCSIFFDATPRNGDTYRCGVQQFGQGPAIPDYISGPCLPVAGASFEFSRLNGINKVVVNYDFGSVKGSGAMQLPKTSFVYGADGLEYYNGSTSLALY